MGVLGRAVFLGPHRDLPEIAVIPHILARALESAVGDVAAFRIGEDATLIRLQLGAEDRDGGAGQVI